MDNSEEQLTPDGIREDVAAELETLAKWAEKNSFNSVGDSKGSFTSVEPAKHGEPGFIIENPNLDQWKEKVRTFNELYGNICNLYAFNGSNEIQFYIIESNGNKKYFRLYVKDGNISIKAAPLDAPLSMGR